MLIPAFNAADTIGATLKSAVSQTHRDIEIVVVDDGSRDDTVVVVDALARADNRIRLIRQNNAGVAAARNRALRESNGMFIAPLDADDLWHPEKIARQLSRLTQSPQAGMVYCWSTDIDEDGIIVEHRLAVEQWEGDVYASLVLSNFIGNGSVPLIRRDLLQAVGGWDSALNRARAQGCEDWLLYLRLAERAPVAVAPAYLVGYRQRTGAMSRDLTQMTRSYDLVMHEARERHPELPATLFRWSRGMFGLYVAEMRWAAGERRSALASGLRAVLADPAWLKRRSTRRKLAGWAGIRRRSSADGRLPYPIGLPFEKLKPERHAIILEGSAIDAREEFVNSIRLNDQARERSLRTETHSN